MAEGTEAYNVEDDIDRGTYGFPVYNIASINQAALVIDRDFIEEASTIEQDRIDAYKVYREWYDGEHKVDLSDRQIQLLEECKIPFSDNFCDVIVDTVTRRLKIANFAFEPEPPNADDVTKKIWRKNRMDIGSKRIHHNCKKLGDSFLIEDFDDDAQAVTMTYIRPDVMAPHYADDAGEVMTHCAKVWTTKEKSVFNPLGKEIQRATIFFDNRIEKYYRAKRDKTAWLPIMDATDELWPIPWVDESERGDDGYPMPLGIPVFHFKNKVLDGHFGVSEIKKTIPQQALLNKLLLDLDLILDTQGYPQRWATGVKEASTNTGDRRDGNDALTFDASPGSVWSTAAAEAKFGQFAPAECTGVLAAIDLIVKHISGGNATPIYDLMNSGRMPSGEALKMRDSGLSDKVDDSQLSFGNDWEDAIRYAHKLRNVRATGEIKVPLEEVEIECIWKDTSPRNEKQEVETAAVMVRDLGASKKWALTKVGVENVDEVIAEAEAEADAGAERATRAFIRGADTTEDIPNATQGD